MGSISDTGYGAIAIRPLHPGSGFENRCKFSDNFRHDSCQIAVVMCREWRRAESEITSADRGFPEGFKRNFQNAKPGLANRRLQPLGHLSGRSAREKGDICRKRVKVGTRKRLITSSVYAAGFGAFCYWRHQNRNR
jgi:hypothetical protein